MEATKKTTHSVLDAQRKEGEARDLLKDLDKLISTRKERKYRWVWELIQNAVDCSADKKVNICFKLDRDRVIIEHDGAPFQIEHLVALVRKTSTKPIEGVEIEEGNENKKGKFGTGFVTTHILNRKVKVSGLLENDLGCRPFSLEIDRSSDSLPILMASLDNTFTEIDRFNDLPPANEIINVKTSFEYELEEYKFSIAKEGLRELEQNLAFTLLINQEQLNSVTITDEENRTKVLFIDTPVKAFGDLFFCLLKTDQSEGNSDSIHGLLYKQLDSMTIALPVEKIGDSFTLLRIEEQARLFRYFPLIGTEKFHLPSLIHSEKFQPTEPRDGIRTIKDNEEKGDKHADDNRSSLTEYVSLFMEIFKDCSSYPVKNLHLMAESGLPDDPQNYLAREWYIKNVQSTLRTALYENKIVKTVNGDTTTIKDAIFIKTSHPEYENELYDLIAQLFPSNCPDKDSYDDWKSIVFQNEEYWPDLSFVGIREVLKLTQDKITLDNIEPYSISPVEWINKLIHYLHKTNEIALSEEFAIYPNQARNLKRRLDIRLDPGFEPLLKDISRGIFRDLYDSLILDEISNQDGIIPFDTPEFFNSLNKYLGSLDVNKATNDQEVAIFKLGSHFRDSIAKKRNEWFEITSSFLPDLSSSKTVTNSLDDFDFESVDKWMLKNVCLKIQQLSDFKTLCENHFNNDTEVGYQWLSRFLSYACLNEDNIDTAFKFSIVLTQDGKFKRYENNLFREKNSLEFHDLFKDLIRDYVGSDPKTYLIDTHISQGYLPEKDANYLTDQIDKIFNESNIDREVEEGGKYNTLFHKLNDWYSKLEAEEEEGSKRPEDYFPIFKGKRPELSVRAFGKEMSKMVAEKGLDEIKALTQLKFKSSDLHKLEQAAEMVGGTQILFDKAKEIFDEAENIRWRKIVGKAAEDAFKESIEEVDIEFELENPDDGKDFTIISKKTKKQFYIEIKSTIENQETVKMSAKQGITASNERERYALCVITRPAETLVEKQYFLDHAKFIPTIGSLIDDKIEKVTQGLNNLSLHELGNVNVTMDNKAYSVFVNKPIWNEGIDFRDFVELIRSYLES